MKDLFEKKKVVTSPIRFLQLKQLSLNVKMHATVFSVCLFLSSYWYRKAHCFKADATTLAEHNQSNEQCFERQTIQMAHDLLPQPLQRQNSHSKV